MNQDSITAEAQLRSLIDQAPVAVAMFDRGMRYIAASSRWLRDYRIDAPVLGHSHYEVFPEIPERWKEIHRRALAGETVTEDEDRFDRADGAVQWLAWTAQPWIEPNGAIGGIIICSEDITARKKADAERELFVSAVQSSRDFIGMCDAAFNPFFVNAAGMRMVGLSNLDEAKRTPVKEFFFPEDQDYIMNEFFPGVLHDGCGEVEIRFRHFKTGEALWMQYSVYSLTEVTSGRTSGYATVSRNITKQKTARQQLAETQRRLQAIMNAAPVGLSYSEGRGSRIRNALAHGNVVYLDEKGFETKGAQVQYLGSLSRYEKTVEERTAAETYRLVVATEAGILHFVKAWATWLAAFEQNTQFLFAAE